ncbi:hypothetical protein AOLI_G00148030 [Acnodon oligacanthus]
MVRKSLCKAPTPTHLHMMGGSTLKVISQVSEGVTSSSCSCSDSRRVVEFGAELVWRFRASDRSGSVSGV